MSFRTGLKYIIPSLRNSFGNPTTATKLSQSESIGLQYVTESIGDTLHINPIAVNQEKLCRVLKSEHCSMPDFMSLIPKSATEEETVMILKALFEESKFFSRVSTCELKYGKNFAFANMMSLLSKKSAKSIYDGKSFEEVLKQIAEGYSKETTINTEITNRIGKSGIYRGNATKPPHIIGGKRVKFKTGYGFYGAKDGYSAYVNRFNQLGKIQTPYKDFTLTKINSSGWFMHHPYNEEVAKNMEIISERYKIYQQLVKEYKKTGYLNTEQIKQADDIISEIYYLMANTCPFVRGSNGISDVLMRSQYTALGINMPHIKSGVGLDLEAFCFELNDYKKNWRAFFEGGGEIRPVIYKSEEITGLVPLERDLVEIAEVCVKEGSIRSTFKKMVENATTIEECRNLMKIATNKLEYTYASMRIPEY